MSNPNFQENRCKRLVAKSLQPLLKVLNKKLYISLQYRYITGHKLDWKHLNRYTEKLQYLRLFVYPKWPDVIKASGRRGAREYVTKLGYEHLLIPSYGIFTDVDAIDFDLLPEQFVMKATHGSGMNYICLDKNKLDKVALRRLFRKYLSTNYGRKTLELHYAPIAKEILIEKYIGEGDQLPIEYKIHVFNGKARYFYVVTGRGKDIRYDNFYINWTPFPGAQFNHWQSSLIPPNKPENWEEMVKVAEALAKDFPFVRLDLYQVDGRIYFSEFTFTPAKGTLIFDNEKADDEIGSWLDINQFR